MSDTGFEILRSIRRIVRCVSEHSRDIARDSGLTVPQLLCLKVIGDTKGEVTVGGVSTEVGLSPATVSRILDRLERSALIARERTATDRRKVCLVLTEAGRERYVTLPQPLQERFLERVERLSPPERMALLASLSEVVHMMDADDMPAAPLLDDSVELV